MPSHHQMTVHAVLRHADRALFLADRACGRAPRVVVGERVRIRPDARRQLRLSDELFTITEVVGTHADAMTKLRAPDGSVYKWFSATDLSLPSGEYEAAQGEAGTQLMELANRIVAESNGKTLLSDAVKQAARQHPKLAHAYREDGVGPSEGTPEVRESTDTPEVAGATLMALANKIVKEEGVSLRVALLKAQRVDPRNAERYFTLMTGR